MIFHFLSWTAIVSAQEFGTDCNAVRKFVYPEADECNGAQTCSDDYACVVTDNCNSYMCVSAPGCPEGTNYQVFSPTFGKNSLNGFYCSEKPPLCGFNSDGQFYIETTVKNKFPWDGVGTPDNRQPSLISKRKFDANVGGIFKQ